MDGGWMGGWMDGGWIDRYVHLYLPDILSTVPAQKPKLAFHFHHFVR